MSRSDTSRAAGNVSSEEAWEGLSAEPESVLVDVRTRPEWAFVGIPDLGAIGKEVVLAEWQSYPGMTANAGFVDLLAAELERRGVGPGTALYFICRSGVRSLAAAEAMAAAGFDRCFNVSGGFEGPLDEGRHRGVVGGWKAAGLPWIQS
jgi:rhodanese-related sulfurtransferase